MLDDHAVLGTAKLPSDAASHAQSPPLNEGSIIIINNNIIIIKMLCRA